MSTRTRAYPLVTAVADGWEKLYPSAVCSGVLPDPAHEKRGGYHVGRAFQNATNYSVIRVDDRGGQGPNDGAAAIDMSLNRKDMLLCTRRLLAVWNNPDDPRRKFLNAFNGWLGTGPAIRRDMVSGKAGTASPDHKWHVHLEVRRRWLLTPAMVVAVLSALRGDTVAQYLQAIGVRVTATAPAGRTATAKGPTVPAYPGRVLRRNDQQSKPDPAVKTWQERMLARGWKSLGKADGMFGARTEDAVKRFQAVCRIGADGTIGPVTWPKPWTQPLGS